MGYVPTGGSGGASIGGSVSGATAGSVFFAGAAGVLAQDNANFFWDNTAKRLQLTSTGDTAADGAMKLSFRGWTGAAYTHGLIINATDAAAYAPIHIRLINTAYGTNGTIACTANDGMVFSAYNASGAKFFFNDQSVTAVTVSTETAEPSAAVSTNAATRVGVQINLASAQSADAFQVKNSGGTTIAYIDANGYYNGQNGSTTRIQNTSVATVGMLLDAGNTRIGAYEGTNYWSLLTSTEIRQKSGSQFSWSSDGTSAVSASADTGLARSAVGIVKITNGSTGAGALHLQEQTAPSAPATNNVYLYAEDNGAGKTRIVALFPTGAAQVLATEP